MTNNYKYGFPAGIMATIIALAMADFVSRTIGFYAFSTELLPRFLYELLENMTGDLANWIRWGGYGRIAMVAIAIYLVMGGLWGVWVYTHQARRLSQSALGAGVFGAVSFAIMRLDPNRVSQFYEVELLTSIVLGAITFAIVLYFLTAMNSPRSTWIGGGVVAIISLIYLANYIAQFP